VYAVDVATGSVRRAATLPAPVSHAPLAALGGRLLLVGGDDVSGRATSSILAIDPADGRVTRPGTLPQALSDAAAVTVGDRVVVLGGGATNASAAVYALR
jgi:N-acetylneuraminic acid mutarotase